MNLLSGRVAVLLPTYNGAKYIEALVESVFRQSYEDILLVIRDDGSTDGTIDLVKSLSEEKGWQDRIVYLEDAQGNMGCMRGFFHLAKSIDADYYAFCDQDDVWLPNKVERAVSALCDRKRPAVYFSSFDYCDGDLNLIRHAPVQESNLPFAKTLFYTPGLGFTIAFNKEARDQFLSVVDDPPCEMHDRWILRCAASMGDVVYDNRPSAMHIRHREAVTADDNRLSDLLRHYLFCELLGEGLAQTVNGIRAFGDLFNERLCNNDRATVSLFSHLGGSASQRLRKAFFPKRLRASLVSDVMLRVLFLCGKA